LTAGFALNVEVSLSEEPLKRYRTVQLSDEPSDVRSFCWDEPVRGAARDVPPAWTNRPIFVADAAQAQIIREFGKMDSSARPYGKLKEQ